MVGISNFWLIRVLDLILPLFPNIVICFVGRNLNKRKGAAYFDQTTGETIRLGHQHTFLFISFEYGAIIGFVLSIWFRQY